MIVECIGPVQGVERAARRGICLKARIIGGWAQAGQQRSSAAVARFEVAIVFGGCGIVGRT